MNNEYLNELADIKIYHIDHASGLIGNFEKNILSSIADNFGCSIFEYQVVKNNPELKSNLNEINICLTSMANGFSKEKYNLTLLKSNLNKFNEIYNTLCKKYLHD